MSSEKQRKAVKWVEAVTRVPFDGDIENSFHCQLYLGDWLSYAKTPTLRPLALKHYHSIREKFPNSFKYSNL